VSKEYNSFELQKQLARKNFGQSYKIVKYLTADGGGGSMPMITSVLYGFYSKLYLALQEPVRSSNHLMGSLGVNYFAAEDLVTGCRNYNQDQVFRAMQVLMEYDLKSKGVEGSGQTGAEDLLKEMLYKLIN
jgi:DNA polymerase-3 subunit delta